MPSSDAARKLFFALAVGVLVAWVLVLGLADGGSSSDHAGAKGRQHSAPHAGTGAAAGNRDHSVVARAALDFTDAYLAYEVGDLPRSDQRNLTRLATRQLATQLLAEPPRQPVTGAPVREWASRVEAVHVGIFQGEPALLAGVIVVGVNGTHVLTATFLERGSRWLVAGIGE